MDTLVMLLMLGFAFIVGTAVGAAAALIGADEKALKELNSMDYTEYEEDEESEFEDFIEENDCDNCMCSYICPVDQGEKCIKEGERE